RQRVARQLSTPDRRRAGRAAHDLHAARLRAGRGLSPPGRRPAGRQAADHGDDARPRSFPRQDHDPERRRHRPPAAEDLSAGPRSRRLLRPIERSRLAPRALPAGETGESMTISDDVLTHMPPEPFKTIGPKVRSGDLLLCAAHDPFSRLIGWATHSPWSHVAIAYRWPALSRIMAFEAVQQIGVRAVPLQTLIRQSSTGEK